MSNTDWWIITAFIVMLGIASYALFVLNPEGKKCIENPLGYQENKMSNNVYKYVCQCREGIDSTFVFNISMKGGNE